MCCWRGSLHARQASARSSLVEPCHMKGSERLGCIILAFVAPFRHYFPCQRRSSPGKWPVFGGRRSGTVGRSGEEPHGNLGKQGRVTEGSAHTSTHSPPSCRHPVCYSASSANKKMTLITFEDHKCSSSNKPQTHCSCSRKKKELGQHLLGKHLQRAVVPSAAPGGTHVRTQGTESLKASVQSTQEMICARATSALYHSSRGSSLRSLLCPRS